MKQNFSSQDPNAQYHNSHSNKSRKSKAWWTSLGMLLVFLIILGSLVLNVFQTSQSDNLTVAQSFVETVDLNPNEVITYESNVVPVFSLITATDAAVSAEPNLASASPSSDVVEAIPSDVPFMEAIAMIGTQDNKRTIPDRQYISYDYKDQENQDDKFYVNADERDQAGLITAAELNDFSQWDLWSNVSEKELREWREYWTIYPKERYTLQLVTDSWIPLVDAAIELTNESGQIIWKARTDNTGKAELWANLNTEKPNSNGKNHAIKIKAGSKKFQIKNAKLITEGVNHLKIPETKAAVTPNRLDISFVVDGTGSMEDELDFLKIEFTDILNRVQENHPDLSIRTSSVFYRDRNDIFQTRQSDLSSESEMTLDFINDQIASAGGDTPEMVDEGLRVAIEDFKWRKSAIARLVFLVLDAPPHHNEEVKARLHKVMEMAAEKGIKIIPITGSDDIESSTEYLLRSMALATNGTYAFLTDDSGLGHQPHHVPVMGNYKVEFLNDLIVRVINQYVSTPRLASKNDETPNKAVIENSLSDIEVYPNPSTGPVTIKYPASVKQLFLVDANGKVLEQINRTNEGQIQMNLNKYPDGIYYIRYMSDYSLKATKIILNR